MMEARVLTAASPPEIDLRERVLQGLRQRPKRVLSSYFYDDEGSRLFRRIMELPGYYLSRAELEILQAAAPRLAGTFAGQNLVVADLGAGDGSKTRVLLRALAGACRDICYAPIDISPGALAALQGEHGPELSRVTLDPLLASFEEGLRTVGARYPGHTRLALLLGSNIGNFPQAEALSLLISLQRALRRGDHLLIGFDLLKDPELLQQAYADDEGVTAAFNLNLLARMNRELGADFDVAAFRHYARYDPGKQAMESYLISTRDQLVRIGPECIGFAAWEAMQTEVSCKYRETDVLYLARSSGLTPVAWYYDGQRRFVDVLLRADLPGAR
jgi:L-histidine Nalpha-methyltransferase